MKLYFNRGDGVVHSISVLEDKNLTDAVMMAVFATTDVRLDNRTEAYHIAQTLRAAPDVPYPLGDGWLSLAGNNSVVA